MKKQLLLVGGTIYVLKIDFVNLINSAKWVSNHIHYNSLNSAGTRKASRWCYYPGHRLRWNHKRRSRSFRWAWVKCKQSITWMRQHRVLHVRSQYLSTWLFGWILSLLKRGRQFHNSLKWSIKATLCARQAGCSLVWRLRSLLKWPVPRPAVGMGPEIKNRLSTMRQGIKKMVKIRFGQLRLLKSWVICSYTYYYFSK